MRAVLEESTYGHYHQTPPKTIFFFKIGFRLKEDNINKNHTFIQIRTITSLPFLSLSIRRKHTSKLADPTWFCQCDCHAKNKHTKIFGGKGKISPSE